MSEHIRTVAIDGVHLHAEHFAAMTRDEGIKAIIADGITKDKALAAKMFAECRKAVKEGTGVEEEEQEKEAVAKLDEINKTRAVSGVEPVTAIPGTGAGTKETGGAAGAKTGGGNKT